MPTLSCLLLQAKTVSPASRPIRWSASKHNQETLDAEEHRLAMQNDRTAHKYGPHQHWRDQHWDGVGCTSTSWLCASCQK